MRISEDKFQLACSSSSVPLIIKFFSFCWLLHQMEKSGSSLNFKGMVWVVWLNRPDTLPGSEGSYIKELLQFTETQVQVENDLANRGNGPHSVNLMWAKKQQHQIRIPKLQEQAFHSHRPSSRKNLLLTCKLHTGALGTATARVQVY